jgi:hypothetical protein
MAAQLAAHPTVLEVSEASLLVCNLLDKVRATAVVVRAVRWGPVRLHTRRMRRCTNHSRWLTCVSVGVGLSGLLQGPVFACASA